MTQIHKNNKKNSEKYYWKKHDLKDASTGATCVECLLKILSEEEKLKFIKS